MVGGIVKFSLYISSSPWFYYYMIREMPVIFLAFEKVPYAFLVVANVLIRLVD